jgi:AhpD family alkylhydroperoxidase
MSDGAPGRNDPRISPEETPDDEQTRLLSKTLLAPDSEPINLFRVLVRYPELMRRVNALGGMFMAHGSLPPREREVVILRVAWNSGCEYEFAQHAPIGRRIGLTQREIESLGKPVEEGDWDEGDTALIRLTDEVTHDHEVSDEVWQLASKGHDDNQMMELVLLAGYYQMLATFLKTVRMPLEEGSPRFPVS